MTSDPSQARVAVAIVNYGVAELIAGALPALLKEFDAFGSAVVFIVDNLSPGDDADRLEAHLARIGDPRAQLIRSERNGGYSASNNIAIKAMERLPWVPDVALLLNPDAEMIPGALVEMNRLLASNPKIGAVGARIRRPEGGGISAAFRFATPMIEFSNATGIGLFANRWPVMEPDMTEPQPVDWVTGAALLIRWEALEQIGSLDEGYFLYYDEIDFLLKMTRAGWEVWHDPQAEVLHSAGASTGISGGMPRAGRMPGYWFDSRNRYFEKNHGWFYARRAAAAKVAGLVLGQLQRRLRGKESQIAPGFIGEFARRCLLRRPGKGAA
jgi:hypothetical protein